MANIAGVVTNLGAGAKSIFWEQINQDDQGAAVGLNPGPAYGLLVATGTLDDGGTYSLQASVDGGVTYATCDSTGGGVTAGDPIELQAVATCGVEIPAGATHFKILNDAQGTTEDGDFTLYLFGIGD